MTTNAKEFSRRLNDDGQCWMTGEGINFDELAQLMDAQVTYSVRDHDVKGNLIYIDGQSCRHISGDPIRYEFPDGSAVVAAGAGWDLEGVIRYSWASVGEGEPDGFVPLPYRVEVRGGENLDNSPRVAVFEVGVESAREIIRLAELVKSNSLSALEKVDCRVEFLQIDPEQSPHEAAELSEENCVSTECDRLVVTATGFYFKACVKHTEEQVLSQAQTIAELSAHFDIPLSGSLAAADCNAAGSGAKLQSLSIDM